MFRWGCRMRTAALPHPLRGAGATPGGGCVPPLSVPVPRPGPCAPMPATNLLPSCLPSPRPAAAAVFVQGRPRGSSESALQSRADFRRRSVFRRQPGHVSGEKSGCSRLSLPAWPARAAPREHLQCPSSKELCSPWAHRTAPWS